MQIILAIITILLVLLIPNVIYLLKENQKIKDKMIRWETSFECFNQIFEGLIQNKVSIEKLKEDVKKIKDDNSHIKLVFEASNNDIRKDLVYIQEEINARRNKKNRK